MERLNQRKYNTPLWKKDFVTKITRAIVNHSQNASMKKKGYKPVFTASKKSRIVIIGQAPGFRAQTSHIPWDDKSGDQLRKWLDVSDDDFYDPNKFSLLPMDFYFPGKGKSGDLRHEGDLLNSWHPQLLEVMQDVKLIILIGQYAQKYYLTEGEPTLTATTKNYANYLEKGYFPIPHPSPRNNIWKAKNPWFEKEVVPILRKKVHAALR